MACTYSFISSQVVRLLVLLTLTGSSSIQASTPENSAGQWLGIINSTTTGLSNIVAVEFDTSKSYTEDVDDNHVGIDVRSAVSIDSKSLSGQCVNLSSGIDIMAIVQYDAQSTIMSVFVSSVNSGEESMEKPILSHHLDLSDYLPEDNYVGFSASTGVNASQLNAVRSWNFTTFETSNKKKHKRLKRELLEDDDSEVDLNIKSSSTSLQKFHLKEHKFATENFSLKNKLGKGGFGTVYKGTLGNKEVAVKRISKNSQHGKQDFIAEVNSIGNVHHKNLVKLIGWYYESNEHLLVYEFMPNGSLDKLIFWNETTAVLKGITLTWERRLNIICGVTQALDYLHNGCEKRVLHRDIEASNIMLDLDSNARLGDFGLA
ncbi:hypothetical protein CRYUN_Cryun15aG0041000 [Craigia yunnanensis]